MNNDKQYKISEDCFAALHTARKKAHPCGCVFCYLAVFIRACPHRHAYFFDLAISSLPGRENTAKIKIKKATLKGCFNESYLAVFIRKTIVFRIVDIFPAGKIGTISIVQCVKRRTTLPEKKAHPCGCVFCYLAVFYLPGPLPAKYFRR